MNSKTKNASVPVSQNGFQIVPVAKLAPNPNQPRKDWGEDEVKDDDGKTKLDRLGESIKAEGILQPLVVTPQNGKFVIVCGERRYRAAQKVKMKDVPCMVKPGLSTKEMLELAITENLQREDLTPIDEARAIKGLVEQCGYSQKEVGKRLGLSVAAVNYKLSLLDLSREIQKDITVGKVSETEGRKIAQAVRKVPTEKRGDAMKAIKAKMDKLRKANGKNKLSTKDVSTIAKTVGEKSRTSPRIKSSAGRSKKAKQEVKLPTAKEKRICSNFAKAFKQVEKTFKPFAGFADNRAERERFAEVLFLTKTDVSKAIKTLHSFLDKIGEELAEAKRKRLVSKMAG